MQIPKIFYSALFLCLISRKVTKFLVEKLSTSEVISQQPHGGGGGGRTPPLLLGLIYDTLPLFGLDFSETETDVRSEGQNFPNKNETRKKYAIGGTIKT